MAVIDKDASCLASKLPPGKTFEAGHLSPGRMGNNTDSRRSLRMNALEGYAQQAELHCACLRESDWQMGGGSRGLQSHLALKQPRTSCDIEKLRMQRADPTMT